MCPMANVKEVPTVRIPSEDSAGDPNGLRKTPLDTKDNA